MNIVGLVRAKNEGKWIRRCVESMLPICTNVVLMDDHSSDDTAAEAEAAGALVIQSPFIRLHESDDKQWLYEALPSFDIQPDWCLMIDGDEMLAPGTAELIQAAVHSNHPWQSYRFKIVYLWDREDQKRVDRWYEHFTRPSLWRCERNQRFVSGYSNGLHCGNTPTGLSCNEIAGADILHFGYMEKATRLRKFEFYNRIDPDNEFEDHYRHMVIGDLPEYPASYVGKRAGPLELSAL